MKVKLVKQENKYIYSFIKINISKVKELKWDNITKNICYEHQGLNFLQNGKVFRDIIKTNKYIDNILIQEYDRKYHNIIDFPGLLKYDNITEYYIFHKDNIKLYY